MVSLCSCHDAGNVLTSSKQAKSLRSKSKRTFRRIKREDPKSVFNAVENLRMANLSSKLKASALKPKAITDAEEYKRKQEGYETEEEGENKDEPGQSAYLTSVTPRRDSSTGSLLTHPRLFTFFSSRQYPL